MLVPDTDGDGLLDGEESTLCTDGAEGCTPGAWFSFTDPFTADCDADGIVDGRDPWPNSPDIDEDGLLDGQEWVHGYNATLVYFDPVADEDLVPTDLRLPRSPAESVRWQVFAEIAPTRVATADAPISNAPPVATLLVDGQTHTFSTRLEGPRFVVTPWSASTTSDVGVSFEGDGYQVLRAGVLVAEPDAVGDALNPLLTFADEPDSDGDGLSDAQEVASGARFFEAEHTADPTLVRVLEPDASNSIVVTAQFNRRSFLAPADALSVLPETDYAVFVRSRRTAEVPATALPVLYAGRPVQRVSTFMPTDQLEWQWAGSFTSPAALPGAPSTGVSLEIYEAGSTETYWELDAVALVPTTFVPFSTDQTYTDFGPELGAVFRVPGIELSAMLTFRTALPTGVSNPMEQDTDGDGLRLRDGALPGSRGWLTDFREQEVLRLNAMDRDTDHDARFGSGTGVMTDRFSGWLWNGATISFTGGPDGLPDFDDANDPAPRVLDTDGDGLLDVIEIQAQLRVLRAACAADALRAGDATCAVVENCAACGSHRFDDIADLTSHCGDALPASLPLCDYADDDIDDDGLPDGTEDSNRNGRLDAAESDPRKPDSDGDCIPDGVEAGLVCPRAEHTLSGAELADESGISLLTPAQGGRPTIVGFVADADPDTTTDRARIDSDADGISDGDGRDAQGLANAAGFWGEDIDCNGARDVDTETAADRADTDGDGLNDGDERRGTGPLSECQLAEFCGVTGACRTDAGCTFGPTDPDNPDTDGDGLSDGEEILRAPGDTRPRTNPTRRDTDSDGISDSDELAGTGPLAGIGPLDPLNSDTDGDGFFDGDELMRSTDPSDETSSPTVVSTSIDGVAIDVTDLERRGDDLVASGRIPLACPGRPAVAFVIGELVFSPGDGRFEMTASGDLVVTDDAGADVLVWSGDTSFSNTGTEAFASSASSRPALFTVAGGSVSVVTDPAECASDDDCIDSACIDGVCEGIEGVDAVDLCSGALLDDQGTLVLDGEPEQRFVASGVRITPDYRPSRRRISVSVWTSIRCVSRGKAARACAPRRWSESAPT